MKITNRKIVVLIIAGITVFTCILFSSFIFENILKPLTLILWLFLRIFVLSIDQIILWIITLAIVISFFIYKISRIQSASIQNESSAAWNIFERKLEYWKLYFSSNPHNPEDIKSLKNVLSRILVSVYASRKRIPANFIVYDAFKKGEIELPEQVYSFLFENEMKRKWFDPRTWISGFSRKKIIEYERGLEESLNYLEEFLDNEVKHRKLDETS
jgi:hypothetical protein